MRFEAGAACSSLYSSDMRVKRVHQSVAEKQMIIPDAPPVEITLNGQTRSFDLDEPLLPDWIKKNSLESGSFPYAKKMDEDLYGRNWRPCKKSLSRCSTGCRRRGSAC
jgi:hypothetical protein